MESFKQKNAWDNSSPILRTKSGFDSKVKWERRYSNLRKNKKKGWKRVQKEIKRLREALGVLEEQKLWEWFARKGKRTKRDQETQTNSSSTIFPPKVHAYTLAQKTGVRFLLGMGLNDLSIPCVLFFSHIVLSGGPEMTDEARQLVELIPSPSTVGRWEKDLARMDAPRFAFNSDCTCGLSPRGLRFGREESFGFIISGFFPQE